MNQPQRVAIVTGGAGGVGAATALMLAQRGYHVAITYQRNRQNADAVVQACQAHGVQALAMAVNVAEDADCQALAHAAHERWGRIDALANCAGTTTFVPLTDMDAVSAQDFQDIYAVNAIGPFQMSRAAAKHMVDGAAIVNVSSLAGETGRGSSYPYVLSKAALNTLTISLARTLAPKIRVNAVSPGLIDGPMVQNLLNLTGSHFIDQTPMKRLGQPEEVASAIAFLCSAEASFITATSMHINGGLYIASG